ncbi:MAG TPA: hypothetical protein VME86_11475 [Acidobacteriaceae bacterium]|nr:hypothetical protein [Acidobacteriaceae bacterium]
MNPCIPHQLPLQHGLEIYYFSYLAACAALIVLLARILHRAGAGFLADLFAGNAPLARAVAHLLAVGLYLVSLGYVGASIRTWEQLITVEAVVQVVIGKLGWLLLLLGFTHLFNLLLLAVFRQRSTRIARAGVLS